MAVNVVSQRTHFIPQRKGLLCKAEENKGAYLFPLDSEHHKHFVEPFGQIVQRRLASQHVIL